MRNSTDNPTIIDIDALVVGGGFAGIGQAYALKNLGLSFKLLESLEEIGGTWPTSIYPGATSDTESFVYRFSWDKEDLQTYPWGRRYLRQPEILAYLKHFVEKHNLRRHMKFNTEMTSAEWNEEDSVWEIKTNTGELYRARYFLPAMGVLSKSHCPVIPGISTFKGHLTHSSEWVKGLDVTDKRVGVLGCGASGVQIITNIAPKVKSLKAFIRRPQYVVPNNNGEISAKHREWVNEHYDQIWRQVQNSFMAFGFVESHRPFFSVNPTRRAQILQDCWDNGNGMRFLTEEFGDLTLDRRANEEVCEFIRSKVRDMVKDEEKARKLVPDELFARRPICMDGYYESYNRDNVDVVALRETPITEITPDGIRTQDGTVHELDVIIFATGFDAIDGNLMRADIRSRGKLLSDFWGKGPQTYLGAFAAGFPNMFMVNGPLSPVGNTIPAIEASIEIITNAIQRAEKCRQSNGSNPRPLVEATFEAQDEWVELCSKLGQGSLMNEVKGSWFTGDNIPGKAVAMRAFFGGMGRFRDLGAGAVKESWKGFKALEVKALEVKA